MTSRCDELQSLMKRGCSEAMIENPHGSMTVIAEKNVTVRKPGEQLKAKEITQIQPQKISLTLRSGEEHSLELSTWFESKWTG